MQLYFKYNCYLLFLCTLSSTHSHLHVSYEFTCTNCVHELKHTYTKMYYLVFVH